MLKVQDVLSRLNILQQHLKILTANLSVKEGENPLAIIASVASTTMQT